MYICTCVCTQSVNEEHYSHMSTVQYSANKGQVTKVCGCYEHFLDGMPKNDAHLNYREESDPLSV